MRVVRNKHNRVGTDGVKTHVMELSRVSRRGGGKLAAAGRGAMVAGRGAVVAGRVGAKGAAIGGRILGAGAKVAGRLAVRGLSAAGRAIGRTESGKAAGHAIGMGARFAGSKARKVSNVAINATNKARLGVARAAGKVGNIAGRIGHAIDHKIASGIKTLTTPKPKSMTAKSPAASKQLALPKPTSPAHGPHVNRANPPPVIHLGPPKPSAPVKNGMPGKPPVVHAPARPAKPAVAHHTPPAAVKPAGRDWRTLPRSGAHDHLQAQPPLKRKRK